jgi:ABC-type cobalamin/Fe3+-siderophores transport system ATPase subunit
LAAREGGSPLLEVRGLRAERGGRVVLDGVDFRAEAGRVSALVGDSGAGKTSLLRCIVGLDAAVAGDVLLDGVSIRSLDPCELRRQVALVAQAPVMLPGDVRANVLYARPGADAAAALAAVGLDAALLGREAEQLSGGERARVAIARALVHEPRALLLDEPTASLHPEAVAAVERLVASLAARGMAVVVVTHDAAQAARLADVELRLPSATAR